MLEAEVRAEIPVVKGYDIWYFFKVFSNGFHVYSTCDVKPTVTYEQAYFQPSHLNNMLRIGQIKRCHVNGGIFLEPFFSLFHYIVRHNLGI